MDQMFHKSGVEIWSRDMFATFRRVVRVSAQTACRANSQSGKHYPWKPSCLWRDASWCISSRHCVPVARPSGFTERCWCHTCCRKQGRWRPEHLERLDIVQYFLSQGPAIFWLSLWNVVEATLWVWLRLRKRAWNRSKGGTAQLLKAWHSPRA